MTRDTVRLPLEPLRRQVADATGRSPALVDITGVELAGNSLEVTFATPDEDVPVVDVVVEGPNGETETTPVRLDEPAGLKVHGELLRIEYAGRDAETNEILVSVDENEGGEWKTLLGCGQMWAVTTRRNGDAVTVTCHVETPGVEVDETEEADAVPTDPVDETGDETGDGEGGFLSNLGND